MTVATGLAGSLTILFLVGFGIFFYPWLLKRRGGLFVAVGLTGLLALLFYGFDAASGSRPGASVTLALVWALLPLLTGVIVKRLQTRGSGSSGP